MAAITELNRESYQVLMSLVAEYSGDVEALVADARAGARARSTGKVKVVPVTARDVTMLKDSGIIGRDEARKYLGLRGQARGAAARRA